MKTICREAFTLSWGMTLSVKKAIMESVVNYDAFNFFFFAFMFLSSVTFETIVFPLRFAFYFYSSWYRSRKEV